MNPIDALISPTLKHLREQWWNDEFAEFLAETLRPRSGNRILDVGCGTGIAELSIGRLHVSQVRMFGVDLKAAEAAEAAKLASAHNLQARFSAGDACHLPFKTASFDSTYCVAVLQHIRDVSLAVAECARVTRPGGRIVAVEPDNAARYAYSSRPSGAEAFRLAAEFFAALAKERGDLSEPAIGPKIPALFAENGIDPVMVKLFPVSCSRLGAPSEDVWSTRRDAVKRVLNGASPALADLASRYLSTLDAYERDARTASDVFVEIQHTMLFATVGQRS